jgi:hypothetical protein
MRSAGVTPASRVVTFIVNRIGILNKGAAIQTAAAYTQ